jgi:predicted DNA-binding protein with PD1-like motif
MMEYKRFENDVVLRLDPGDEIVAAVTDLASKEDIALAEVRGLGALNEIVVGVFNTVDKTYASNTFTGPYEMTSLVGTITRMDGKPYVHLHLSAGDQEGNVIGGHLNKAVISATAEIVVRIIEGQVGRIHSDEIGLNIFQF